MPSSDGLSVKPFLTLPGWSGEFEIFFFPLPCSSLSLNYRMELNQKIWYSLAISTKGFQSSVKAELQEPSSYRNNFDWLWTLPFSAAWLHPKDFAFYPTCLPLKGLHYRPSFEMSLGGAAFFFLFFFLVYASPIFKLSF